MKIVEEKRSDENITNEKVLELEESFLQTYFTGEKKQSFLKTLHIICKGHYKSIIVSMFFCILQLSAELFLPIATANIIDALTIQPENYIKTIITNIAIAALLLLINYPLQIIYKKNMSLACRYIEAKLRSAVVVKIQHLKLRFCKELALGRIPAKIMFDVDSIRSLISTFMSRSIHIVLNIVTILVVTISKGNYLIIVFYIAIAPIIYILIKLSRTNIKESAFKFRENRENTTAALVEMAEMIPVTKAHALEDVQIKSLSDDISKTATAGYIHDMVVAKFVVINWIMLKVLGLLCLALLCFFSIKGILTVGEIVLYNTYFSTIIATISSVVDLAPQITTGVDALNSVSEILDSDDIEENEGKQKITNLKGIFHFENASFEYHDANGKRAINNLNLHVNEGETIALVGESGSGKSTIINLVCGFDYITSGSFTIDGIEASKINLNSYRKNIAVVLQNSILFSGTVRENITYGSPNISDKKLNEIIELSCLKDVVDELPNGVDTLIGEHGGKLSGGQKQRISIARALIRTPKIIIFDEATSALDTVSEKHIQTAIENLSKDKTTFIVAHRLSTVKNADKIAVIEDGRCVEFGTYDELVAKKGAFYKFREMQI